MFESGLRAQLLTIDALTALIGRRVYPLVPPEDLSGYPCITYQVGSTTREYSNDSDVGLVTKRIIVNAFSPQYGEVQSIVVAIIDALSGWSGTLPDGTRVDSVRVATCSDFYESDARMFRASLHLLVTHGQ
jgi:hypothetical protein